MSYSWKKHILTLETLTLSSQIVQMFTFRE